MRAAGSAEGATVLPLEKKEKKKKHSPLQVKEELREKLEKEREAAGGPYVELRRVTPPLGEERSAPTAATGFSFGRKLPLAKQVFFLPLSLSRVQFSCFCT